MRRCWPSSACPSIACRSSHRPRFLRRLCHPAPRARCRPGRGTGTRFLAQSCRLPAELPLWLDPSVVESPTPLLRPVRARVRALCMPVNAHRRQIFGWCKAGSAAAAGSPAGLSPSQKPQIQLALIEQLSLKTVPWSLCAVPQLATGSDPICNSAKSHSSRLSGLVAGPPQHRVVLVLDPGCTLHLCRVQLSLSPAAWQAFHLQPQYVSPMRQAGCQADAVGPCHLRIPVQRGKEGRTARTSHAASGYIAQHMIHLQRRCTHLRRGRPVMLST